MLYLAWDRENNISLFFASPLYENEAPGLEQAAVVTLATRVLRPLKRAFLTLTLIIQLDSSVLKENHKYICFFKWKFFGNWDPYLTRTMHTKVKFHEPRFFSLRLVFFLYFPILFFSAKLTLNETPLFIFFRFFPLFSEVVSHDVECFYCCNVKENGRSMWTGHLGVKRWRSK